MKTSSFRIKKYEGDLVTEVSDAIAREVPLQISLEYTSRGQKVRKVLSITMCTPGDEKELATGFLLTEGIVTDHHAIESIIAPSKEDEDRQCLVQLKTDARIEENHLDRNFYMSSSCGVCGKSSLDAVKMHVPLVLKKAVPALKIEVINQLGHSVRKAQTQFQSTGAIHATALFRIDGQLIQLKEDVGRHNAMDKVIGAAAYDQLLPLENHILWVSGRASFELVQKSLVAGAPVLVSVGAPSSLAIELAQSHRMTLIGFQRKVDSTCILILID